MLYPQHIIDEVDKFTDNSIFYILEIACDEKEPHYKFGISTDVRVRVRKHCRKIGIKKVVKLIDCKYDSVMRCVETDFKRYARSIGVMITKFGQTEILNTNDIDTYVNRIMTMVNIELLKPQPANNRNRKANEIKIEQNLRMWHEKMERKIQKAEIKILGAFLDDLQKDKEEMRIIIEQLQKDKEEMQKMFK